MTLLTTATVTWLESRGISGDTAARYGLFTADQSARLPVLVFPFIEHGEIVNEKFRELPKGKFWQRKNPRKTFWNADVLDDPSLLRRSPDGVSTGTYPLIITEGEMDALAAIESGFPHTVSVPDGAPPAGALSGRAEETDLQAEQTGKFEFLFNCKEALRSIARFIIAVDSDAPGQVLAEQLTRRLSAGRCSFVTYPKGCKDLNDVLMKHGPDAVRSVLDSAKQYPIRGIYKMSDFPDEPLQTFTTGWPLLDPHLKLFAGEFMVVTGIPSHGKSSWVLNLLANVAEKHGLRSAIFSPEMRVKPMIRDRLRCLRAKKSIGQAATRAVDDWIEDNFTFITSDPGRSVSDDDFNLNWVLERAEDAVLRDGIRILLIDPWNEVEHAVGTRSMTEYVGASIRQMRRFGMQYNLVIIVVAHPTKLVKVKRKDGEDQIDAPTLYDISDSAHWYNKADHGVVLHRDTFDRTSVSVVKSRYEEAGERGSIFMKYDKSLRCFTKLDEPQQPELPKK